MAKPRGSAAGAYLAAFIASHLVAVFILGRQALHVDTNWDFAVGAPAGLMGDPWNVRLLPHYSLAVFLLSAHAACGLRGVLLGHRARLSVANRVGGVLIALGAPKRSLLPSLTLPLPTLSLQSQQLVNP
jgi:hypothetical protein